MLHQTFNVHFILKANKTNKKGLAPIFLSIKMNSVKIEITTNKSIARENWSTEGESISPLTKINKETNQYLENFRGKIYRGYCSLLSTGEGIYAELLKEAIFGKPIKKKHYLIEVAREHNIKLKITKYL